MGLGSQPQTLKAPHSRSRPVILNQRVALICLPLSGMWCLQAPGVRLQGWEVRPKVRTAQRHGSSRPQALIWLLPAPLPSHSSSLRQQGRHSPTSPPGMSSPVQNVMSSIEDAYGRVRCTAGLLAPVGACEVSGRVPGQLKMYCFTPKALPRPRPPHQFLHQ